MCAVREDTSPEIVTLEGRGGDTPGRRIPLLLITVGEEERIPEVSMTALQGTQLGACTPNSHTHHIGRAISRTEVREVSVGLPPLGRREVHLPLDKWGIDSRINPRVMRTNLKKLICTKSMSPLIGENPSAT